MYFEEERYGTTVESFGSELAGRSHIRFCGYLIRESITINPDTNEVTFEAEAPLGILGLTPALTQLLISDTTPAKWSEIKGLTLRRAAWYLLYWGSTYTDVFDFRYHALSLVAVLVALGLGLLLGVAIGDKELVSSANKDLVDDLRGDVRHANQRADELLCVGRHTARYVHDSSASCVSARSIRTEAWCPCAARRPRNLVAP